MGKLRVTGGRYVRRTIAVPKGEIRPAMDRMRVSVFATLGDLEGRSFLDLFSGSGIIGIEAASRGASPVVLVEQDPGKRSTIEANLRFVESAIELRIAPAERYIATTRRRFDLVFLDPPFRYSDKAALVASIDERDLVPQGGLLLLHHPSVERLPEAIGRFAIEDRRSYGRSVVLFYRRA